MKIKHKRIVLTGFMGTGKTVVGEALAKRLDYQFLDTDLMVEEATGQTITEIFEKEGETVFRMWEKKMVKTALGKEKVVIATGGGAVADLDSLQLMKELSFVIGLSSSPEAILERIASMQTRPLMKSKDQMQKIKSLLSQRSPYYREANKIIDTTSKAIPTTVEEIMMALQADHDTAN